MKTFLKTTVAFSSTLALSAGMLFGQAQTVQFDENGHITVNGAVSPFAVGPDPSGGVTANVLIYQLPFLVNPGDIGLLEAGSATNGPPSDLVRFFTPSGANTSEIIFYSDIETPGTEHDLADTGLPVVSPNAFFVSETGAEGNNGANWASVNTAPGALPGGGEVIYTAISDAPVPEPSFGPLLFAGLATLLGIGRLRRNWCA